MMLFTYEPVLVFVHRDVAMCGWMGKRVEVILGFIFADAAAACVIWVEIHSAGSFGSRAATSSIISGRVIKILSLGVAATAVGERGVALLV